MTNDEFKKLKTVKVKVFFKGDETAEYVVQLSDTPLDVIEKYIGQRGSIYCLKSSSGILDNDQSLVSQGVTENSVLEGENRMID